jgi:membrane-bound lytic murein transglycosylase A
MIFHTPRQSRVLTRRCLTVAVLIIAAAFPSMADAKRKHSAHKRDPLQIPNAAMTLLTWDSLDGWKRDYHAAALGAFLTSCRPILQLSKSGRAKRPIHDALYDVCGRAIAALPLDNDGARRFFEKNFHPVRIAPLGETEGFFTGYYEPIVEGARLPSDIYTVPLYRRPPDLLRSRMRHGKGKKKFSKGKRGSYYDRVQIENGAIAGRGLEICYLKDPIDAFFAQIQGSVRVRLEDGSIIRLNYDAQNGHPYTAVGRFLIERNIYTREEISMQKIREWMEANPEEGEKLRHENKSYVFFRESDLGPYEDPPGAQGVELTPGRSIAVDRKLHTYGMPFYIDAVLPITSETPDTKFQRLMIAQDTGGAIVGPARADIYLGAGAEAARAAGRFKQNGLFVMLVPNELNPGKLAKPAPVPLPRPQIDRIASSGRKIENRAGVSSAAVEVASAARSVRLRPQIPLPRARPSKKK